MGFYGKCSCGAQKTYGAGPLSPLHSSWCDVRPNAKPFSLKDYVAAAPTGTLPPPPLATKPYCNWMHFPSNQKPAVKIAQINGGFVASLVGGLVSAMYACQDCIDTANKSPTLVFTTWDLNDPNAPKVP